MLYVVTAVHNRRAVTERFMAGLKEQRGCAWRLVLVDDGCTDSAAEMVRGACPSAVNAPGDGGERLCCTW